MKLEDRAEKSLARLQELRAAVDLAPVAVSLVRQLKQSFGMSEIGHLQGARDALK